AYCHFGGTEGSQIFETAVAITLIDVVGIRLETPAITVDSIKTLRSRHIQRPQDQRIQYAENHGICTNAQCERDDGNGRKAGRFPQHANREPNVLRNVLDRGYASRLTAFLGGAIEAAELHAGLPLRLSRITILPRLHLEMKLQFVLEVLLRLTAKEQRAQ